MRSGERTHCGFAYLLFLLFLAAVAGVTALTVTAGAQSDRRAAEERLLEIGTEFDRAFQSYRAAPATTLSRNPKSLNDLLRDPRSPGLRRYLRKIYVDPLTSRQDWGVIKDADGTLLGIYSAAPGMPLKQNGFVGSLESFNSATSYQAWVFGLPPSLQKTNTGRPDRFR